MRSSSEKHLKQVIHSAKEALYALFGMDHQHNNSKRVIEGMHAMNSGQMEMQLLPFYSCYHPGFKGS